MNRIICILLIGSFFIFSCSKDEEEINHAPEADFKYSDGIDRFLLVSTSDDADDAILSYQWISKSQLITINNASSSSASFKIPQLTESIEVTIEHIVSDEYLSDTISKNIRLPVLTEVRKWGLGYNLETELSNNVDYEWYMDQKNTGTYAYVNCGPTVVTMAIKWVNKNFEKTPMDARNTYRSSGGWWYTDDIINYLNKYSVNNTMISIDKSDSLIKELDKKNIIILCLDMYYINEGDEAEWRINRFYAVKEKEWGHFIILKGYKIVDNQLLYEVYDPYSFGVSYIDQTLKGKDRYYKSREIDEATNNWWDYAIIVSRSNLKSSKGFDIDEIEHKYGI